LNRKKASFLLAVPAAALIAGCSSHVMPVHYVGASDPVLGVCQQAVVLNLDNLDHLVDQANSSNPDAGDSGSGPQSMSPQQQASLASTAKQLAADEKTIRPLHPQLAGAFGYEVSLLNLASQGNNGFTTNSIAVSLDNYTSIIDSDCSSYQPGTPMASSKPSAPASPGKPGPGFLTSVATPMAEMAEGAAAYLFVAMISSFLIARAERKLPRSKRLSGDRIAWSGLMWPISLLGYVGSAWTSKLESATLTPHERREDELTRANEALEAENQRLRKLNDDDS
jgi:hypothetical protein